MNTKDRLSHTADCGIRKGINIWSFAPDKPLDACMRLAKQAGFEGIELALADNGPVRRDSSPKELAQIRAMADSEGLVLNSLATGLYWQVSLTSDRADIRAQAEALVRQQLDIGAALGVDCILVCPGMVGVDFRPEEVVPDAQNLRYFAGSEVIDYDVAYERALSAFVRLAPAAEAARVVIGIENIWNKFLLSPLEMRDFLDKIDSQWVGAFLDVGNTLAFGYPQHWIKILGSRIRKVHFKDYRRAVGSLSGFVDLLAGDVDWDKVYEALVSAGYQGWVNAEMCPTYRLYTDQMIHNCSGAMDRILRRI